MQTLFGDVDELAAHRAAANAVLRKEFIVPPFSILSARDGYWYLLKGEGRFCNQHSWTSGGPGEKTDTPDRDERIF